MRPVYDEEEHQSLSAGADTEITLGMKSLLGVFFGAVLICGVFFGFGYSLGRNNAQPSPTTGPSATNHVAVAAKPSAEPAAPDSSSDSEIKTVVSDPAASNPDQSESQPSGSRAAISTPATQYDYVPAPGGPARRPADAPAKPRAAVALAAAPEATAPVSAPATPPTAEPAALTTTHAAAPPQSQPSSAASNPSGPTMVQIAAVSHQEDAAILAAALRKRGYAVLVRSDPNDSLLHVQLGPFASRDEARSMRNRLLADGYNAILK